MAKKRQLTTFYFLFLTELGNHFFVSNPAKVALF